MARRSTTARRTRGSGSAGTTWTRAASAPAKSWTPSLPVVMGKVVVEEMTHGRERCLAVQLAHLGDGGFCLVEYMNRRGVPDDVFHEHCLLYATRFRLRYDRNGALHAGRDVTRSGRSPTRSRSERSESG
ncbi:hypothetical protein PR202_gb18962 [Eleusine coracana subsp. coracana]|uniref:Uncharacterized protein n=1 Tax=Eleusine coracana subsp. coracana TaxID=191504 RepID=A0AAV5F7I7_ELECO|nr:hypothetical protein PR202_gb18962 [Eleusine coracana subsp. coracana]